jgi:hypothetical protein
MAWPTQRKLLSLDANLVFDLAREKDFAYEFLETFSARGYGLVLPPAAVYELHVIHSSSGRAEERDWAKAGLANLQRWRIKPFDLDGPSEAIAEQFARRLLHRRLIPDDEFDDGLILAQTSLAQIPLLVTSDKHLLDIDDDELLLAFSDADLFPVRPVHPKRLVRALRG